MAREDYVKVMEEGRVKREKAFVQVYVPSKKKDSSKDTCCSPVGDWEQTVLLKKKDFPDMLNWKVGDQVELTIKGPLVRLDKEGVSVGVHQVKVD
jgi:hypothetical protein